MDKSPLLFLGVVATGLLTVTLVMHNRSPGLEAHDASQTIAAHPGIAVPLPVSANTGPASTPMPSAPARGHHRDDAPQPTLQEALAQQDAKFLAEPSSAAWAAPRESLIESTFTSAQLKQDAAPTPLSHEASCRSATCRINATYRNSAESQTATLSVLGHISSSLPNTVMAQVPNPDGTVQLVLYASSGHPYPGHLSR